MPTVKTIDEYKVKELLKSCPKQVRDYVKALQGVIEAKNETNNRLLKALKTAKSNESVKTFYCAESRNTGNTYCIKQCLDCKLDHFEDEQ